MIDGGPGLDDITGSQGDDVLTGGTERDIFGFGPTAAINGVDHITDFNPAERDRLDFDGPLQFISFLVQRDANPGGGTSFDAFTANPSRPFLLNHQLVKLVDIPGNEDITTANGLRQAFAVGGEYSNFDLRNSYQRAVVYAASSATATTFKAFYVTGTNNAAGDPTVELVGVIDFAPGSNFSTLV